METISIEVWIGLSFFLFTTVSGLTVYIWNKRSDRTDKFMENIQTVMMQMIDRLARIETNIESDINVNKEIKKKSDDYEVRISKLEARISALEAILSKST